jgi:hypothetical protein
MLINVSIELDYKLVIDGIIGNLNTRTGFRALLHFCRASLFVFFTKL